jgi:hypothetical protein
MNTVTDTTRSQPPLIVDQLLQKDPSTLRLTLTRSIVYCVRERFEELMHALQNNDTVTTLYLGPYFYSSLTDDERSIFCETVGRECHQLTVWTITTLDLTTARFSGNAMGRALGQSSILQSLRIERTLLIEDVNMLAAGFHHHPTLRRVTLPRLLPDVHTTADAVAVAATDTAILDPLLIALRTIPNLEAVELGLDEKCVWMKKNTSTSSGTSSGSSASASITSAVPHVMATSPAALASLAAHPALTWLVVGRCQLQDAHVQAMAAALTHQPSCSSRLKDLDLSGHNNPCLTQVSWQAVIDMLQSNTRLEMVRLPSPPSLLQSSSSSSLGATATATAVTSKALVHMYLRLNRQGRGRLWSSSSDTDTATETATPTTTSSPLPTSSSRTIDIDHSWWPVLADCDDLSAIWILLRGNPMLCEHVVYEGGAE